MKPPVYSATLPLHSTLESSRRKTARTARHRPTSPAPKDVPLNFSEFFRHLREDANNAVLVEFLRSIDKRACVEIASYVVCYLKRSEEKELMSARKKRGNEVQRKLSSAIRSLRQTAVQYRALAGIRMEGGSLLEAGAPFWPQGFPFLADVLESEASRLNDISANCKQVFNYKRLGVSGTHLWLVNLQEFVVTWTEQELGQNRPLQIEEIAALIYAGELALGRESNSTTSDPELIGKAIRKFRHNPANAQLLGKNGIRSRMLVRCQQVKEHPYLVGIEI